jgi:hypothetical protein
MFIWIYGRMNSPNLLSALDLNTPRYRTWGSEFHRIGFHRTNYGVHEPMSAAMREFNEVIGLFDFILWPVISFWIASGWLQRRTGHCGNCLEAFVIFHRKCLKKMPFRIFFEIFVWSAAEAFLPQSALVWLCRPTQLFVLLRINCALHVLLYIVPVTGWHTQWTLLSLHQLIVVTGIIRYLFLFFILYVFVCALCL